MKPSRLDYLRNRARMAGFSAGSDLAEAIQIIDELRSALMPLAMACGSGGPFRHPEPGEYCENDYLFDDHEIIAARKALGMTATATEAAKECTDCEPGHGETP